MTDRTDDQADHDLEVEPVNGLDQEVWANVAQIFDFLADESHPLWNLTADEARGKYVTVDFSKVALGHIEADVTPAAAQFLLTVGEDADRVLPRFVLACAVVFGASDLETIPFTPRALASYVNEEMRIRSE